MTRVMSSCVGLTLWTVAAIAGAQTPTRQLGSVAPYAITGTIADHDGHGVPDAEIALVEHESPTRLVHSDTSGRFQMNGLPTPQVTLRVRRLGYQPRSIDLNLDGADGHQPLIISLDVMPAELAKVSVTDTAEELDARLRDFYTRKTTNSFGKYIEGSTIEKRRPQFVSEMLRTIPGVNVVASNRIGNTVRIRGCSPLVWVDGVRIPGAQLDDLARPADVAGMEIYSSFAGIPAQYFDRTATCGTILVWTRTK